MKALALALCAGMLSGCATLADVMQERAEGGGTTRVYAIATDQAWQIAVTVLRWEGAGPIEEHRAEGYMLTSFDANFVTAGTVAGVWIASAPNGTGVTVVTKRKMQTNLATVLTESGFHRRFAEAVAIIGRGEPLPLVSP